MAGPVTVFDVSSYLNSPDSLVIPKREKSIATLDSIYYVASEAGMTLREYVTANPDEALLIAERNMAEWSKMLGDAIVNGFIMSEEGRRVTVNKFITDLFKDRIRRAEAELENVTRLAQIAQSNSATRRDTVLNVLYDSALKGNTRAMQMIMDRADGRVAERKDTGTFDHNPYLVNVHKVIHSMFDKQLEVMNSGPGRKMICCSRRSGKSHMDVGQILTTAMLSPNTPCLFIGPTQKRAEKLFKIPAEEMITKLQLTDSKGERLKWSKLENGSFIDIRGLSNIRDPDATRGPKYKIIIIDEFFHLKSELVEYYMDEVLEPMQMDFGPDFQFIMTGTPPKKRKTFGEKLWTERGYRKYMWTWRDNPYIIGGEEYLAKLCQEKGIDPSSPFYQREYEGNWVFDTDFLLYPDYYTFDVDNPPAIKPTRVVIGIDYGSVDHTAILGIAWDADTMQGYEFFNAKFNTASVGGRGQLQVLKEKCKDAWTTALQMFPSLSLAERNKRILWVADSNGMSKEFTVELYRDVGIEGHPDIKMNIRDAHRTDQQLIQDKTRDLLRTAGLLFQHGSPICIECELTGMVLDTSGNPTNEINHKLYHPDLLACLRYVGWELYGRADIQLKLDETRIEDEDADFMYGGSFDTEFQMSLKPVSLDGRMVATAGVRGAKANAGGKFIATTNFGPGKGNDFIAVPEGWQPLADRMRNNE